MEADLLETGMLDMKAFTCYVERIRILLMTWNPFQGSQGAGSSPARPIARDR